MATTTTNEWFRNEEWNAAIEARFLKLRKSRNKGQRLRIQACHLVEKHPEAALALLNKYFSLGDHFFDAQALVDEATAYESPGRIDEAICSLQKALHQEREFPNVKTEAWSHYALLIAVHSRGSKYAEALRVLAENESDFLFPVQTFRWHAASALIRAAQGHRKLAKEHAIEALKAARMGRSRMRNHPKQGLVGSGYADLRSTLLLLTGPNS